MRWRKRTNKKKAKRSAGKRVSRSLIRNARRKKGGKKSDLEQIAKDWLIEDGVPHRDEYKVSRCHADYYLPNTNTIVEVNGCHWHGHTCIKEPTSKETKARLRDSKRYSFFLNAGYNLVILWGCEIKKDPEIARKRLRHAAGL